MFTNRIFYNAAEACQMAESIKKEREQKQLEELFDKIDTYVKAGEFETHFVAPLSDFQVDWLVKNGYKVVKVNDTNTWKDGMMKISWKKLKIIKLIQL